MGKKISGLSACRLKKGKMPVVFLLFASLNGPVQSQESSGLPLSLDEAVAIALNNNPGIRNAGLMVTKSETLKTGAWDFSPLRFTWQYGQMYSTENDRYLAINQNFGSLLTRIRQYGMAKKQAEASLSELEISKKSLVAQVKSAYFFWWYMHEKQSVGKEETSLFDDVQRIAGLRYQLGEFSELERTMASSRAAAIRNNLDRLGDEILIAENKLKQLMMTEEDLIPPEESFPMYRIDKPSDTAGFSNSLITAFYEKSAEVRSAALKTERAKFFPELFAGYFYQDINPYKGLTGWQVGFSFPLLAFGQASKIKEAKIDEEIAMNRLAYEAFLTDKTIENLVAELTMYFRQIQYYNEYGLNQADEIIRSARIQFEKENMDYMEYVQSLSMALSIKTQYLETLNNYNQTAIQLEFYAY
jgi:cobalt-zinc-cadmium resistance protein CzcA